jgi:cell division FtsZ-interacting protein ZapD
VRPRDLAILVQVAEQRNRLQGLAKALQTQFSSLTTWLSRPNLDMERCQGQYKLYVQSDYAAIACSSKRVRIKGNYIASWLSDV